MNRRGDVSLGQNFLPSIRSVIGETFTFQQDDTPAHRARNTVEYLSHRITGICRTGPVYGPTPFTLRYVEMKWKCIDFKCVQKRTKSWLSL